MTKKESIDLEDLIKQTEDKITNNEFFEDVTVEYKNLSVNVRIQPISQSRFTTISKNKKALETAEFNTLMIHECVLNKHDNKKFTIDQINRLFTGGLAAALCIKCCQVSGIKLTPEELKKMEHF